MRFPTLLAVLLLSSSFACATPAGSTLAQMRTSTLDVRDTALQQIYAEYPALQEEVAAALGYAFCSNFSIHPLLCSFANGYGVVQDNRTGEQTFIRMTRFGLGPGLSVKGFYALLVVQDEETLDQLVAGTWISGTFAEASFVFGDFGGDAAAMGTFSDSTHGYTFTHTGFALEATIDVGRVSENEELRR